MVIFSAIFIVAAVIWRVWFGVTRIVPKYKNLTPFDSSPENNNMTMYGGGVGLLLTVVGCAVYLVAGQFFAATAFAILAAMISYELWLYVSNTGLFSVFSVWFGNKLNLR